VEILPQIGPGIERLDLARNRILGSQVEYLFSMFADVIEAKLPVLRHFSIAGFRPLPSSSLVELVMAIGASPAVVDLDLSDATLGLTSQCAVFELATALRTRAMTHLDISWNQLAEGLTAVGAALADSACTLQYLSLSQNSIGQTEAARRALCAMLENLRQNHGLTEVDFSFSGIGPVAAEVLAGALENHRTMRKVSLQGNPLGAGGLQNVVLVLLNSPCLQDVALGRLEKSGMEEQVLFNYKNTVCIASLSF
jgi:Ran GTPase-activating protein (RanGAP) involved in mRNA processing and transport